MCTGCAENEKKTKQPALFYDITAQSGIAFANMLTVTERLNPYTYRNFYNGAGVAIGDVNNDGLLDIYFAGNQVDNRLYLNKGNLQFQDITKEAGVACPDVWSTGVTFVDINRDGWLDIYVCKSGDPESPRRFNELFINNGDLTFTERAAEYGLDIVGLSVQATFFDYDKDGDLDCYLLTNSIRSVGNYDLVKDQRLIPDPDGGGNRFLVNEDGKFRDYSDAAGVYSSNIGFGLGITLGDYNQDGWTDIFVSNDFFERDYLYINQKDGTFKESLTEYFGSISMGSMGADFADLDNDGLAELFVTEMLPDSLSRRKTKTVFETWDKHRLSVSSGYHFQYPRNVLQKNVGRETYVEVGRFAGIAATEWSWGALMFDMNNDGLRDIFVANGIYKDLLDRDYLTYSGTEQNIRSMIRNEEDVILKLIGLMPSSSFPNYAFLNEGGLKFRNVSVEWGLAEPMYSSGSAYGDLDNDGDLDLVVNNLNGSSILYRNNTDVDKFRSITIIPKDSANSLAVGAEVRAYAGDQVFFGENFVTRGFQSSVHPYIHIGLGENIETLDSLILTWPSGKLTRLFGLKTNERLVIDASQDAITHREPAGREPSKPPELTFTKLESSGFKHKASGLVDFNRDRLLPMMYSNETPFVAPVDTAEGSISMIYVGGGKDQEGCFVRIDGDRVHTIEAGDWSKYSLSEETKSVFFDIDGDGDKDFYMANGGRFFPKTSSALMDRIFLNDGAFHFKESSVPLPFKEFFSTSAVIPFDFDNDSDYDLFVGERFHPFVYGIGGRGYLLRNEGNGVFSDVTREFAPGLENIGMVTDAEAVDYDNDGWTDLVIVGDWMPIVILKNTDGYFSLERDNFPVSNTEGWWHCVETSDLNQDGKPDFIVGNHGLNSFSTVDDRMYVSDFDSNGSIEQIFTTRVGTKDYPTADRDELISQMPALKKRLLYYKDYARLAIDQLFSEEQLRNAQILKVKTLASKVLISGKDGYELRDLPDKAQYAPVYAIKIADINGDGIDDLIVGGNHFMVKPQFGQYDGSRAWYFKGTLADGNFTFEPGQSINVRGQIRDIELIKQNDVNYLLFSKYDDELEIVKIER